MSVQEGAEWLVMLKLLLKEITWYWICGLIIYI